MKRLIKTSRYLRKPGRSQASAIVQRVLLGLAVALLCAAPAFGAPVQSYEQLLQQAASVRSSDPELFAALLEKLDARSEQADALQHQRLQYLQTYSMAVYGDELDLAIEQGQKLFASTRDVDLKFRVGALVANIYAVKRDFSEGLRYLDEVLKLRPEVKNVDTRHNGIQAAAVLYNQLGQYKIGRQYAQEILSDNPNSRQRCIANNVKLEADYHLGVLSGGGESLLPVIALCESQDEMIAASLLRNTLARLWASQSRQAEAIQLLRDHMDEVQATQYPRLIAEVNALLSELLLEQGDVASAESHALTAIAKSEGLTNTLMLSAAFKTLYEIAVQRDEPAQALEYFKQYAAADKAYLNDVKARELAYQIVRHESMQKSQQIALLNQQNQVLQLRRKLDQQAAENTRLLIILLTILLLVIGYWAYQTRRRQGALRRLAETDALTGVGNRQHFTRQAQEALILCEQQGEPAALVMFDLDHFKDINDSYGHVTGDWALKRVAEVCAAQCRQVDHFGRLGGEEFAFLLRGYDLPAAARVAEDCRARIAAIDSADSGHAFRISASFGVASTATSGYELAALMVRADKLLYQAKRSGRNRVCSQLDQASNVIGHPVVSQVRVATADS